MISDILSKLPLNEIMIAIGGIVLLILRKIYHNLTKVTQQVTKNGGASIADAVTRIEARLADIIAMNRVESQLDMRMLFKTDANGLFLWANPAYRDFLNVDHEDIQGLGWISIVNIDDRAKVRDEWESSMKDRRKFIMRFNVTPFNSSESIPVMSKAYPMLVNNEVKGYYGLLWPINDETSTLT